ncbi:MAG: phosphomannomutase/phosphoglucomutase, partial [Clostridia bacterium]|nr:phosphomannomutase/phosphoglucomutase [Clostridia bacterium]
DGMFPNHVPNPEDKTAMEAISNSVLHNGCDLGIIFDTDVDRSACVDEKGREINRNALIALAAAIALEDNEGGTIVTDSVTSSGLKTFIEETLGGKHCRFKRGYKNVINEAKRLNLEESTNAPLAIETSGHAAMRENYFLDDGAYLATKIIIKAAQLKREGKVLGDLIADLQEPAEAEEFRLKILPENFRDIGQQVIDDLAAVVSDADDYEVAPDNAEGIRASKPEVDGWFLLRLSVHDPVMPLNIESNTPGGVDNILRDLREFFRMYEVLDSGCLQK